MLDWLAERTSVESSITEESMRYASKWVPTDDTPVAKELGVESHDPAETFTDALRSLHQLGVLKTKQVGRLATD